MRDGYLVILSGTSEEHAGYLYSGVGFVIAPSAIASVINFCLLGDRLASLKIKTSGGVANIPCGYAPHAGKDYEFRKSFFDSFTKAWKRPGSHTCTFGYGDFNARLYKREAGEEDVIGDYMYESSPPSRRAQSNKELLLETCRATNSIIGNTFFEHTANNTVTYYEPAGGINASSPVSQEHFAQLDFCLVGASNIDMVGNIWSDRTAALPTRHYVVLTTLNMQFERTQKKEPKQLCCLATLRGPPKLDTAFGETFVDAYSKLPKTESVDNTAANVAHAMHEASQVAVRAQARRHRPWISGATIALLAQRDQARADGTGEEPQLNKEIKKAVRRDKTKWLESTLVGGSWKAIRALKTTPSKTPVAIKNKEGDAVESDQRSNTLADYFENEQWKISFPDKLPGGTDFLGHPLHIDTDEFSMNELRQALKALAVSKAAGTDGIYPEFWKFLSGSEDACGSLLALCTACWRQKRIPAEWKTAKVVLLFKKGDASLPENYRPISLLTVGYKVLAWMLQKRIQNGGAEERIRSTQFGFRPKRGTIDAITIARRIFDAAYAAEEPGVLAILLDWAKAFDRIKHESMFIALARFGIPVQMVDMVKAIYDGRSLYLKDPGGDSTTRTQNAGIAQGCPLSPYLFIIVQTVMMFDVDKMYSSMASDFEEPDYVVCGDLLYADDTVLLSASPVRLQLVLDLIIQEGEKYGLQLNWKKTVMMRIRNDGQVFSPDGHALESVEQAVYLGGLLSTTANSKPEVTRRIGEAKRIFKLLGKCWSHANITKRRKLELFRAIVLPKLLYNLESLWLLKAERNRLDSFQAACLRQILKIPNAYISRVSNDEVRAHAGARPLSVDLLERQGKLYNKISHLPEGHILRDLVCEPGGNTPRKWCRKRKRGRPKCQWASCVFPYAF